MTAIVGYQVNRPPGTPSLPHEGNLYTYVLAGNGVFVRADRPGLSALIPVGNCEVRGLHALQPGIELEYPRLSEGYLQRLLDLSVSACVAHGSPIEALFHLIWLKAEKRWRLDKPQQAATVASVRPLEDGDGSSYQRALIEVHSHHEMDPDFSGTDDEDEQGFRIYGVIGNIFTEPKLRLRVGVYGHFWELPAKTVFEMPAGIAEALDEEGS